MRLRMLPHSAQRMNRWLILLQISVGSNATSAGTWSRQKPIFQKIIDAPFVDSTDRTFMKYDSAASGAYLRILPVSLYRV